MLPCFINFIFNSFVISYWMYFVVIERKKDILKKCLATENNQLKCSYYFQFALDAPK